MPSSFALSRMVMTTWETAYRPNTVGPNTVRARMTPTAKLLIRMMTVLSMLQRAPERTFWPRLVGVAIWHRRERPRCTGANVAGYRAGSKTNSSAGPIVSATRPRAMAPAATPCTAASTVRSRKTSSPMNRSVTVPPTARMSTSSWVSRSTP